MFNWLFGSKNTVDRAPTASIPDYERKALKAIENGNLEELKELISQYNINPSEKCHVRFIQGPYTYLIYAAQHNRSDIIRYLHSIGCDINQALRSEETAVLRAAYLNRIDALNTLIELGARVNVGDAEKNPLYMTIVRNKYAEPIEILLKNGADLEQFLGVMTDDIYSRMGNHIKECLNRFLAWRERRKIFLLKLKSQSAYNKLPFGVLKEICEYM